jgi:GNAT superfamily N-acetyltransferase
MSRRGSLVLRDADRSDAEAIATVFALSAAWAYERIFPPELLARYTPARQQDRWAAHLDSPPAGRHVVAATLADQIVGFVEAGPAVEEPGFGEVHYLFIHPGRSRAGVGGRLLQVAEDRLAASGYQAALLWVFSGNALARSFYERVGWTPAGVERPEPGLAAGGQNVPECRYEKRPLGMASRTI